jgi:hypothetical protein
MQSGLEVSEERDEQKKLHGLHTPINSKDVTSPSSLSSSSSLVTTMLQNLSTPGQ